MSGGCEWMCSDFKIFPCSSNNFYPGQNMPGLIIISNKYTLMKLTSIIFITPNSINKHLSHVIQMHIHAYIQRVHDSELYSGIQGQCKCLWTLVDSDMYMRHVDIFPHYYLCFFFSYFLPKDFITPHIINNHMTDFPHHHNIMYDFTPLYSPVSSTFSCYL